MKTAFTVRRGHRRRGHRRRGHRRRGFVTIVVLLMTGVLLMLAYLTGRLSFESFRRESRAHLHALADEALLSARAWSELHADALDASPTEIDLQGIAPPGVAMTLTLRLVPSADADARQVECELRLTRGGSSLERQTAWMAGRGRARTAGNDRSAE